jgi:iron complex outermembrane recepter protein
VNGLELAGTLRPVRGLLLSANGAYTDGELKDDAPPASGGLKGDPLPYVPKWSGALNVDYEFPLGGFEGFVGGTIGRVGRRVANLDERDEDGGPVRIPGYTEVDVRAGANIDRWTIQAFVRNLFDKGGITSATGFDGTTFPGGAAGIAVIRPRTIGLVATVSY